MFTAKIVESKLKKGMAGDVVASLGGMISAYAEFAGVLGDTLGSDETREKVDRMVISLFEQNREDMTRVITIGRRIAKQVEQLVPHLQAISNNVGDNLDIMALGEHLSEKTNPAAKAYAEKVEKVVEPMVKHFA